MQTHNVNNSFIVQELQASLDSASYGGMRDRVKAQIKETKDALADIYSE